MSLKSRRLQIECVLGNPARIQDNLPQSLDVVSTVGSSREIGQVELDLVPALVKSHGHGADEWLDSRRRLVVRSSESAAHVLVIQHLHFEGEVFLQLWSHSNKEPWLDTASESGTTTTYVLDDHDEEGELDREGLLLVDGASDVVCRDVSAHDLDDGRLNVRVGQPLDVAVSHVLVPDLQGLGTKGQSRRTQVRRATCRGTYPME